ncbi:hypothetical protein [Bacillus infantis]|uniref:hypothetical protein n=1 Tax=Bacillus infantis TaxID=324767 RepID=UPI003CE8BCE6
MRLSRVEKYKKRKQQRVTFFKDKAAMKKVLVSYTVASAVLYSSSIVYAELGLSDHLRNWYQDRVSEVQGYLASEVVAETNVQKAQLLRQVREQTEHSIVELQQYAVERKEALNNSIREKAKKTGDVIDSDNQQDVEDAKQRLDEEIQPDPLEEVIEPKKGEKPAVSEETQTTEETPAEGEPVKPAEPAPSEGTGSTENPSAEDPPAEKEPGDTDASSKN